MKETDRALAEGILYTDLYQITMAQVYFRNGLHETPAHFDHFYRSNPDYGRHTSGFCICAGLGTVVDWMERARFGEPEIDYLRGRVGSSGRPLFDAAFLDWLGRHGDFGGISIRAIPEGRVVHPNVPLTVVEGPLAMAQIFETALLNHVNYQTLVATKAARIRRSGGGRLFLEFGTRRAHGLAAIEGARAALIGGADYSSNVGASSAVGVEPKGTHAHSMVQAFLADGGSELDAFRAYAETFPDDCLLLVDTVDTLHSGVPNAIRVFEELRRRGHEPLGIRLDSGDLAYLAVQAARQLDRAGFPGTSIVLSNQLDELVLMQIVAQVRDEARRYGLDGDAIVGRLVYGVGTGLITSKGDPALDGVYKLVAVNRGGAWKPAIKLSENAAKIPNPGQKRVFRLYDRRETAIADLVTLEDERPAEADRLVLRHPIEESTWHAVERGELSEVEPLLVEFVRDGRRIAPLPTLEAMREARARDVARLHPGVLRILNPHVYHVSLSERLWSLKMDLVRTARAAI